MSQDDHFAGFTKSQRAMLLRVVKECQKSQLRGSKGSWKDFVKTEVPTLTKADPALHDWKTLAAFVDSLSKPQAGILLKSHRDWEQHQQQRAAFIRRLGQQNATEATQNSTWPLVQQTLAHPRYSENCTFPSFEQGWIRSGSSGLNVESAPTLLSLDCEMCETSTSKRELIGLSLVNSTGSTVLKMLVKPPGNVVNWRTEVTGATEATMQGVTYSKKDAQGAVQKLLQGNVVLVGHALHHDLIALQLDPIVCIDTSLLYTYKGLVTCTPSLANLVSQMLSQSLRQEGAPHDCEQDAAAAMQLVNHVLQHGIPAEMQAPEIKVSKDELKKLFVHSIPESALPADLLQLFAACTCSRPEFEGSTKDRKGLFVFRHAGDANEAFKQLPGAQDTDSFGRAQKILKLTIGTCQGKIVKIRKMAAHNGLAFGKDSGQKLHTIQQAVNKQEKRQHKSTAHGKPHKKRKTKENATAVTPTVVKAPVLQHE